MVRERAVTDGHNGAAVKGKTPYDRAALGFRNYWYPACRSKEVRERKPKAMKLLGDEVVFLRRNGKAYALADECPHRGTRLSRGKYEFPGTDTISCRYHGWTFDVTNGSCVAALTDGPDSPVVGKVRVRTYPVEERKGIVWVWMGKMAPVPLEEDVPPLVLKEDTWLDTRSVVVYGNWRWHAENPPGHAFMVHRDSIYMLFIQSPACLIEEGFTIEDQGEDGEWLHWTSRGAVQFGEFPGLGKWPRPRPWRSTKNERVVKKDFNTKPIHGDRFNEGRYSRGSIRLPGITRIIHAPITGCMYYEWYVPVDEDHYSYFQLTCYWPKNLFDRLWFYAKHYLWGYWTQFIRFNSQDLAMVRDSTDYAKRHGFNSPSRIYDPDIVNFAWREYCNTRARGESVEPAAEPEKEPAATEGT